MPPNSPKSRPIAPRPVARAAAKVDRRLLGRWKSDRRKTFQNVTLPKLSPEALKLFQSMFGRIVIEWGRTHVVIEDGQRKLTSRYELLAQDADSVVVRTFFEDSLIAGERLWQIHFNGRHYGVVAGNMIEWFRKVDGPGNGESDPA